MWSENYVETCSLSNAEAQYLKEKVNQPGYTINHKGINHDCNDIYREMENKNYNTYKKENGQT